MQRSALLPWLLYLAPHHDRAGFAGGQRRDDDRCFTIRDGACHRSGGAKLGNRIINPVLDALIRGQFQIGWDGDCNGQIANRRFSGRALIAYAELNFGTGYQRGICGPIFRIRKEARPAYSGQWDGPERNVCHLEKGAVSCRVCHGRIRSWRPAKTCSVFAVMVIH